MRPVIIVGAGLSGAVMAEQLAGAGQPVTVIDRRAHIGGNCWSYDDPHTGIEVHAYGPHIFHTDKEEVWAYVSRFTAWNGYRHHVFSRHQGRVYPMPINLATIESFYGLTLSPQEAAAFIAQEAAKEGLTEPRNLEEKAISLIGRPLYEAFIRGYTMKQWEKDPRELAAGIITRLPVRFSYDSRYFNDRFEGIPLNGYAAIFEKMLAHPLIEVRLNTGWREVKDTLAPESPIFYTGAIDEFFDFSLGRLEWRTVSFDKEVHEGADFQGAASINEADEAVPFTRVHEYRHFHPERACGNTTLVFRETSHATRPGEEPYYPVNTARNRELYARYQALARQAAPNVVFGGRLGTYTYLDMDDAIAAALAAVTQMNARLGQGA